MKDPDAAAAAQLEAGLIAMGALDEHVVSAQTGHPPEWVVKMLELHNQRFAAGEGALCPHLAEAARAGLHIGVEAMANLAAWMPGHMACTPCTAGGIFAPDDQVENETCDVCREHSPGALMQGLYQGGATIIHYGVCFACHMTGADSVAGT